jgi:arginyl-tRNA synthetase
MNLEHTLRAQLQDACSSVFGVRAENFQLQPTNPGFEGTHTVVCFPLVKLSKKGPEETARLLGDYLVAKTGTVRRYNVVKGFLNLVIADSAWVEVFKSLQHDKQFGVFPSRDEEIMVEYSSPNTNKPLHLGHLRNNFLGWSVAEIYKTLGYTVHKVQIINDRGIHISKSMAAWRLYGHGETPESTGWKGDKLVGKYYVEFDRVYKAQVNELEAGGMGKDNAEKEAPIMKLATEMLQQWEQKDPGILALWKKMNQWVYEGFAVTYREMGVDFEKLYYESDTYLLGKKEVLNGLATGVFFRKEDGSVWVDLTADGLDQKVLLRADGTSVYITQDIGTAILRYRDFPKITRQIYTVGNEQEYHFKVLFLILARLGYAWASACYHLSYGMVDLPSGKMKSREGTVVDADDLMNEMVEEAEKQTRALGKIDELSGTEVKALSEMIGLGALKYFLLKVDPKKRMMFDPNESIQLQGHTGPFIQYTHARVKSILRKAKDLAIDSGGDFSVQHLEPSERDVINLIHTYPERIKEAGREYSPAVVANYMYDLAKAYNQFYQQIPIFQESDSEKLKFRIALSAVVADTLRKGMSLLGIAVPDRM